VGVAVIAGVGGLHPRPKTLITPALFSRPLPPPSPGEEGEQPRRDSRDTKDTRDEKHDGLNRVPLSRGREGVGEGTGVRGLGWGKLGWGDALALFALAVFTAFALSGWIAMPDFVYHWGLKGHRFYLARGVDYPFLAHRWSWAIHPDYPNLVPE